MRRRRKPGRPQWVDFGAAIVRHKVALDRNAGPRRVSAMEWVLVTPYGALPTVLSAGGMLSRSVITCP